MLDFLGSFFLLMPLFHQFPDGNSLDSFCLKPISHRSNFSSSLNPRFTETFHFQFISIMILPSWEMVRNWITGNHPKIVKYKLLFCPRHFMLAFETNSICEIQHCLLVLVCTKRFSDYKHKKVSKKVSRYGNSIVSCKRGWVH